MSLALYLSNVGIPLNAAQSFENEYGACDPVEFCAGLDECARLIAFNERPVKLPPTLEPWYTLYTEIANNGHQPARQTYLDTVPQLPDAVQFAVIDAIDTRADALNIWRQNVTQTKKRGSHDIVLDLTNSGYAFAYNQFTRCVECNGETMTDEQEAVIFTKMRDLGHKSMAAVKDAWITEATLKHPYHPLRRYFNSLSWNGHDTIGDVASFFQSDGDIFGTWLRRWCIGAVARVMEPCQSRVLIVDGAQGIGKDYFVKWLAKPLAPYFYEGSIDTEDKDNKVRLLSTWIWLVNEFGHTSRRADREAFKQFISTEKVKVRRAYGRYDMEGQAISAFFGTVNNEIGILSDNTGERRFMIAHVTAIDWAYTKIDVDQLWAQAVALYLAGESWHLTPEEKEIADGINEQYKVADVVEENIVKYFDVDINNRQWWTSTIDILETLKNPTQANLKIGDVELARRIAGALVRLKLGKAERNRQSGIQLRGYYGIKRKIP